MTMTTMNIKQEKKNCEDHAQKKKSNKRKKSKHTNKIKIHRKS